MRQCSEETAKPLEHPINKDGCHGLRVSFSNEVECTKERPDTMVVDGNAMLQGYRRCECLQAAVWKLRHWGTSVVWSIPAELLNILFSKWRSTNTAQARDRIQNQTRRKSVHVFTDHQALLCLTLRCCVRCRIRTNYVAQSARSLRFQGSNSCVLHHGDVSLGKLVVPRHVAQENQRQKQRTTPERSKRFLGTLGLRMLGGAKKRGCSSCAAEMQWSAAKTGVTSALWLHDATNAYLSTKRDVEESVDQCICDPYL